jgi:glycerophosphoryl diester phosphodiesterase
MKQALVRRSVLTQLPNPTIIAHRGASAHAPENTLAAFELAVRQQADVVELDTKLSSDGHVVVIHDQTVDRTTPGTGKIEALSLAVLRQLDAGSHFDIAFKGEPIPTLDEVLDAVGQKIVMNIELGIFSPLVNPLPDKVAELVKRHKLSKRVIFSSFNPISLRRIHRLIPEAPIALLSRPGPRGSWARSFLGKLLVPYHVLEPSFRDTSAGLVHRAHQSHRRVFVYTINQAEDMRRLFTWGVDGIFTDDPLLARRMLTASERML